MAMSLLWVANIAYRPALPQQFLPSRITVSMTTTIKTVNFARRIAYKKDHVTVVKSSSTMLMKRIDGKAKRPVCKMEK